MLEIKNLHAEVESLKILKGINLNIKKGEIHAIMGPNGSGKSTLASILAGKEDYNVSKGKIIFENENIIDMSPDERANKGLFLSFQYPVEIPGVSIANFMKMSINSKRKYNNLNKMSSSKMLAKMKEKMKMLEMSSDFISRSINAGFSGGEKKRNEIFQMAMLDPKMAILDETDSGLDIDAIKIVANGVNKIFSKDKSILMITHYKRLLEYVKPDFIHVLYDGKIVKSGDYSLANFLEEKGYDWIKKTKK
tara:strand:- start:640 stop:1389 length:750 start_codon:yes stop_codon:yes gene_type:complete